ncbi:Hsp20/alpha crystallin family protein [Flavihumibacter petaseus]|nr:Hsp20/alpha crystallin family protein [Flavihumibacter petaseus]
MKKNANFPTFPTLFEDLFGRELIHWNNGNFSSTSTTVPSVNIRETADSFEVEMAAPGIDKKDFNISLEGNTLTIASQRQEQDGQNGNGYSRREFSYQSFQRSFVLPKDVVDDENIEARYENGLLRLTIPKKEDARKKGPRHIQIG